MDPRRRLAAYEDGVIAPNVELRPYQTRALDEARAHYAAGKRRVLLVAPTGAGKTVMFCAMARGHVAKGGHVLIIVHRAELLDQAVARLRREGVEGVGEIIADRPRDPDARVQVASIGTLLSMAKRGESLPKATLLVLDEAHHYVADEWGAIASSYATAKVIGVTATPERGDGTALGDLFDVLVVVASVRELTQLGFLVPCEVQAPSKKRKTLAQDPVEAYTEHGGERQAVVFHGSVEASRACVGSFAEVGIIADHVDGETKPADRKAILDRFARGEIQVLCNCFVLTEGWDCPRVEVCILARGFTHVGAYLQAVGRILRPSAETGKATALVIDLRGAAVTHGLPDADRVFSLEGRAIGLAPVKKCFSCAAEIPLAAAVCPACGYVFPTAYGSALGLAEPKEALRMLTHARVERAYWDDLVVTAAARGFRPGWAVHKFENRFGRKPWSWWRETYGAAA